MVAVGIDTNSGRGRKLAIAVLFCVVGILINFAGAQLTAATGAPLFLDCIGTVLAAAVGGYIPGILVGYITNIINGFVDSTALYYGVLNVLIAVASAYFARHGWFKKPYKIVLSILILALIGGCLGSVLTWFIYGFGGEGTSADLAAYLHVNAGMSEFGSQVNADFVIDLIDKAVVVAIAAVVLRFLPKRISAMFQFEIWQQTPLSEDQLEAVGHEKPRIASVQTKFIAIVSVIMVLVAVVTTGMSFITFNHSMVDSEANFGYGIVRLVTKEVDADKVNYYLENGEDSPGYKETETALADIRDSFPDVQYIYVYKILKDGCHVVFDPDTSEEQGSDLGEVIAFDKAFEQYLPDLFAGNPIDPVVSNETYGWLLTVYHPLYDSSRNCVCYVAVDISMDHIVNDSFSFMARVIALFGAFFILICAFVLWLAKYSIILPVNSISLVSNGFAFDSEATREHTVDEVRRLDVHTGDEIENLYRSVVKTAEDTVRFIAEDEAKKETIDRMQTNLIMVMADLVESRDQFTGDHVRKTAAYTKIIMEELRREGAYADQLTDDFMSDVVRSAPLHDIGKIVVSDTILNKPGRLTDEEFAIMRSHTTAGAQILEKAASAVSEPTYLDEAKNLAAYHHEKWNGKGYPSGLAGEDIPLSARIMAVADVFDALVSKRSYKDGFPLEKAFSIIEEDAGTHFDPLVAQAFLNARDEAAAIAEEHGDSEGTGSDEQVAKA